MNMLEIPHRLQAISHYLGLFFLHIFRLKVSQFFQLGKDALYTFLNGLFVGLNHQFRILWLLIGIIYSGEAFDFAFSNLFVETLDIALLADFKRAFNIHLDKIANLFSCPCACFAIGCDSSRNANHSIACQQATYKCNAFNIGIAVLAAKAESLAQMRSYHITIQYLNLMPTFFQAFLDDFRKCALTSARKPCKPDSESDIRHCILSP